MSVSATAAGKMPEGAVYLDTNVICRWRSFGELDRLALSIAADQIGQEIVVPELVMVEAAAYQERELRAAVERFDLAEKELVRLHDLEYIHTEPQPDTDRRVREWRQQLEDMCEIVPLDESDAALALKHEAYGRAPARERIAGKPGAGARDAAIWLAVLRDHRERGEAGYFLTKNTRDFLDGDLLKPSLAEDLAAIEHPLEIRVGIEGLLDGLGTSAQEVSVDPQAVTIEAFAAVQHGLANTLTVPRTVFSSTASHRFRTAIKEGEAEEVLRARRFARGGESILMVDAKWTLTADCLYQDVTPEDANLWGVLRDVKLTGRVQVYLPQVNQGPGEGQLIAAQLKANQSVSFMEDGGISIFKDI